MATELHGGQFSKGAHGCAGGIHHRARGLCPEVGQLLPTDRLRAPALHLVKAAQVSFFGPRQVAIAQLHFTHQQAIHGLAVPVQTLAQLNCRQGLAELAQRLLCACVLRGGTGDALEGMSQHQTQLVIQRGATSLGARAIEAQRDLADQQVRQPVIGTCLVHLLGHCAQDAGLLRDVDVRHRGVVVQVQCEVLPRLFGAQLRVGQVKPSADRHTGVVRLGVLGVASQGAIGFVPETVMEGREIQPSAQAAGVHDGRGVQARALRVARQLPVDAKDIGPTEVVVGGHIGPRGLSAQAAGARVICAGRARHKSALIGRQVQMRRAGRRSGLHDELADNAWQLIDDGSIA